MRRIQVIGTAGLLIMALLLACSQEPTGAQVGTETKGQATGGVKPYAAQDFSKLKGMSGFSDTLLDMHFTLYQGYVKNTNLLLEQLQQMVAQNQTGSPAYAELKRRFGWEFDGMRLHELYFANLGGKEPWPRLPRLTFLAAAVLLPIYSPLRWWLTAERVKGGGWLMLASGGFQAGDGRGSWYPILFATSAWVRPAALRAGINAPNTANSSSKASYSALNSGFSLHSATISSCVFILDLSQPAPGAPYTPPINPWSAPPCRPAAGR